MNSSIDFYSSILVLIGLMGLIFLFLGIRIITLRRPLILSTRWMLAYAFLLFIPVIVSRFLLDPGWKELGTSLLFIPVFLFTFFILYKRWIQGYYVIGIHQKSFRAALSYGMETLGLSYHEQLSSITIETTGEQYSIEFQALSGHCHLRPTDPKRREALEPLVRAMGLYFTTQRVKINYLSPIAMIFLSVMILLPLLMQAW